MGFLFGGGAAGGAASGAAGSAATGAATSAATEGLASGAASNALASAPTSAASSAGSFQPPVYEKTFGEKFSGGAKKFGQGMDKFAKQAQNYAPGTNPGSPQATADSFEPMQQAPSQGGSSSFSELMKYLSTQGQ